MNIQEDYVSFETAKLLKEKGFDWECYAYYDTTKHPDYMLEHSGSEMDSNDGPDCYISAPTLQMAMKWLREVHNLQIQIAPINSRYKNWTFGIYRDFSALTIELICYPTYEEACEAAIKYCLENLV